MEMKNFFLGLTALSLIVLFLPGSVTGQVSSSTADGASGLREMIEKKNVEIQQIQTQREAVEKNLNEVSKNGNNLKKELQSIDYNVNQLNLAAKANTLTLERIDLEINSIKSDTVQIEGDIANQKETIVKLLIELQKKDGESFFLSFFKNKNLGQSIAEAETISRLNKNLSDTADELRSFQNQLTEKLGSEEQTKKNREVEKINLLNRQYLIQDQKNEKQQLLAQTKNQEKIYRDQITDLVKKQQAIGDELGKIEDQLRASFDPSLLPVKRPGVFAYPLQDARISQNYGNTNFAEWAYKSKFHNGLDFQAALGTPVFAAADGKIKAIGNNGRLQYGKFILIEHENNLATLYAHLSRYIVQAGDLVKRGDIIGYSGRTGYATGPHLHFGVYWAPSVNLKSFPGAGPVPIGITINPADYL